MKDVDLNQIFATDKEIYDLVMASPKRITDGVISELLVNRRIFCSNLNSRDELAGYFASMQHDYHEIAALVHKGEHVRRVERTTSVEFGVELAPEEIRAAAIEYANSTKRTENVSVPVNTLERTRVNVEYDEIDYSRTRLIQRQRKHAEIDFAIQNGKTRIRMPATEKSRKIVREFREFIAAHRKATINSDEISVSDLTSTQDRNSFFMSLIGKMQNFRLEMITDTKVARKTDENDDAEGAEDEDDNLINEAQRGLVSIVNSVTLKGVNVTMTPEYKKFLEQNFFLTAITWRAVQTEAPYDLVQFEAAFEDGRGGTRFRYSVRYAPMLDKQRHARTFQAVSEPKRSILFNLIEDTARKVLHDIRSSK